MAGRLTCQRGRFERDFDTPKDFTLIRHDQIIGPATKVQVVIREGPKVSLRRIGRNDPEPTEPVRCDQRDVEPARKMAFTTNQVGHACSGIDQYRPSVNQAVGRVVSEEQGRRGVPTRCGGYPPPPGRELVDVMQVWVVRSLSPTLGHRVERGGRFKRWLTEDLAKIVASQLGPPSTRISDKVHHQEKDGRFSSHRALPTLAGRRVGSQ